MGTRYHALVLGIALGVIGIIGFAPALLEEPTGAPPLMIDAGHGLLFGLVPVNAMRNAVYLVFAAWGIMAFRYTIAARAFARAMAWIFGVLAVMGLIPFLQTAIGLMPLHGHAIWLHAIIAGIAAHFGYRMTDSPDGAERGPIYAGGRSC